MAYEASLVVDDGPEVVEPVEIPRIPIAELARARNFKQSPAALYLGTLTTHASRRTAKQSMQRITRVFGQPDPDAWISFPWERVDYQGAMFVRAKLIETNAPV